MVRATALMVMALLERAAGAMDVGTEHVCATVGSTAKCWGSNRWGQLGRGDNVTNIGDDPAEMGDNLVGVSLGGIVSDMALGEDHTCMLMDSDEVFCFGKNDEGQLGLGDTDARNEADGAIDFGTGLTAVAITAGCTHTCALLNDGTVKCFGYNDFGQLGQGTTDNAGDHTGEMGDALAAVDLAGKVSAIAAGCDFTCALMEDGTIMCWGRNTAGQLGTGDTDNRLDGSALELVAVDLNGSVATAIAAGEEHVCALLDDSSIKCWGRNNNGQLGQGDDIDRGLTPATLGAALPAIELGTGDVPVAIDCGSFYSCALLDDGSVKCFGQNEDGELGTGTTGDVGLVPTDMGDNLVAAQVGDTVQDVDAGGSTTCAVLSDDSVICWGRGSAGQLGQGASESIIVIADVAPIDLGTDTFALTVSPTSMPSSAPSSAPTSSAFASSAAPSSSFAATVGPTAGTRQIGTSAPTSASSLDTESSKSAPAHFNGGLLATVVLGSIGAISVLFL